MRFFITGAAGFIGSHLSEALLKEGHEILGIDNFNSFYSENIKIKNILEVSKKTPYLNELLSIETREERIEKALEVAKTESYTLFYGDIRDYAAMEERISKFKPDFIINIAALAGVRPSLENPIEYEEVNVKGLMTLLELAKKYSVKKFIQASSSSVYGNSKTVPFKETDVVDFAISPYAATKKSGEVMGHVYHKLYSIDMFQLRFFTVYGPRQRPDLAIHKFTGKILKGEPITFFGDGSTYRDYTYISDIIDGIMKTIAYLCANSSVYEIINLGESEPVSLKEMVETIEGATGVKAILDRQPMQPGDVDRTYADISKAKNLIGYAPKTSFREGIEKFVNWYRGEI